MISETRNPIDGRATIQTPQLCKGRLVAPMGESTQSRLCAMWHVAWHMGVWLDETHEPQIGLQSRAASCGDVGR